ncbi:hypothetical protein CPB83DRAFT_845536 [Crepidotus variabilis]|uniref:G domain-containing protein n=1 Tax=Crepidotus variabilis TaxID=179855 RepID=A0A9P6JTX7_9AGAR|nr:hypothetical protein CPB83DRAFT_845536 [Crepidotus variabilis]
MKCDPLNVTTSSQGCGDLHACKARHPDTSLAFTTGKHHQRAWAYSPHIAPLSASPHFCAASLSDPMNATLPTQATSGPVATSRNVGAEIASSGYRPKRSDTIIAVMGPTGTGKSTFVNTVAGRDASPVGDDLSSCTKEIKVVECEVQGRQIVLVDTPGFNDTNLTDMDILRMIADWLKQTYEEGIELCGLLYFHRITDNRMAGSPLRLLDTFKNICGTAACKNVILTTTMWDEVDETQGCQREEELRKNYWHTMITFGARTARFSNTAPSACDIISRVDADTRLPVLLQKELVTLGKSLPDTAAGRSLFGWVAELIANLKRTVEDLRRRLARLKVFDGRGRRDLRKKIEVEEKRQKALNSILTSYSPHQARSQDTLVSMGSETTAFLESSDSESWLVVEEMKNPPNTPCDNARARDRSFLQGTITTLRIMRELAGFAPVPGVRNVITLALQIVEGVENIGGVDESLVILARNASSLATSILEITQDKCEPSLNDRINEFIRDLTTIDNTVKTIGKRSTAARFFLSNADKQTVEDANRKLILAISALGMHAAVHNAVSNARVEEKMEQVLNLLRSIHGPGFHAVPSSFDL